MNPKLFRGAMLHLPDGFARNTQNLADLGESSRSSPFQAIAEREQAPLCIGQVPRLVELLLERVGHVQDGSVVRRAARAWWPLVPDFVAV